jgi:hypothetical protein
MQILAIYSSTTVWRRRGDPKVCQGSYPSEYTIEYTFQGIYIEKYLKIFSPPGQE